MQYLSDAWIHAANVALSAQIQPGRPLTVVQQVRGARTYQICRDTTGASCTAVDGTTWSPNAIVFSQDWATACRIAQNGVDAHQALLLGDIRFTGDAAALIKHADSFEEIATALLPVMAQTTFPEQFCS